MDELRRHILKSGGGAALALLLGAGLLRPTRVLAANWNAPAFESKDVAGALRGLGAGAAQAQASADLKLDAPEIAENGAVVPLEIVSKIPNTSAIAVLIEKNPQPLAGHFEFSGPLLPQVSLRVKMAETSMVRVLALAGGKYYSSSKEIKVTAGGCGG
ncbi:MAG: thiosulfate oxidation carrier protein SoxY [Rhodocyclaceae bacterium]|nr:thiosulfate oxidation carrier protein SoxY [Rhodocyclaceae bacterium]